MSGPADPPQEDGEAERRDETSSAVEPGAHESPHPEALPSGRTPSGPAASGPPGAATFSLEGRAAPGLYFVGWLGTLIGLGILVVALLAGGGTSAAVLALVGVIVLSIGLIAAAGAQALERRRRAAVAEAMAASGDAPPPARAYAGPSPFLVFLASLPLTVIVVGILIVPFVVAGVSVTSPAAALLSVVLTSLIYVALVRLLVVGPGALSWREMGITRFDRGAVRDLASGAALALPIVVVTAILGDILVALLHATPESPLPPSSDLPGLLANLVAAGLIAPLGEELFFRGFSTTAWARGMGERRGLIRGAIFFAIVHVLTIGGASFEQAFAIAVVAFAGRLPVSFALGWIFLRRRSLYASIGLHATFNATIVILSEVAARSIGS